MTNLSDREQLKEAIEVLKMCIIPLEPDNKSVRTLIALGERYLSASEELPEEMNMEGIKKIIGSGYSQSEYGLACECFNRCLDQVTPIVALLKSDADNLNKSCEKWFSEVKRLKENNHGLRYEVAMFKDIIAKARGCLPLLKQPQDGQGGLRQWVGYMKDQGHDEAIEECRLEYAKLEYDIVQLQSQLSHMSKSAGVESILNKIYNAGQLCSMYPDKSHLLPGDTTFISASQYQDLAQAIHDSIMGVGR